MPDTPGALRWDRPDVEGQRHEVLGQQGACLLYTSDAADERSSVDLGGRRIIKKKIKKKIRRRPGVN